MLRSAWAFIAAPFPAALLQSTVVGLWPKEGMGVFQNPASMFVAICIYYYLFGLLIGLPARLVMRKRSAMGLRAYAIVGLIVGLLPVGTALGWTIIQGNASAYIIAYNLMFFGLGGLAAGSMYWLIARLSRDRLAPEQAKA